VTPHDDYLLKRRQRRPLLWLWRPSTSIKFSDKVFLSTRYSRQQHGCLCIPALRWRSLYNFRGRKRHRNQGFSCTYLCAYHRVHASYYRPISLQFLLHSFHPSLCDSVELGTSDGCSLIQTNVDNVSLLFSCVSFSHTHSCIANLLAR
jgi:hypothetical protein